MRDEKLSNIRKNKSCESLITGKGKPMDIFKKNGVSQEQKKITGKGMPKNILANKNKIQIQKEIVGRRTTINKLKKKI